MRSNLGRFPEYVLIFFRDSYFTKQLLTTACKEAIQICLVSQIIIVLVELCKGNCQNLLGESYSYLTTCNFTEKEPHGSYFPITFEKNFQNTVLCQNTGKGTEGTEVFP